MLNPQKEEQWKIDKLGCISASRFSDILVKPRKKDEPLSKTAETYLREKITELLTGESRELSSEALSWGTDTEQQAREEYELANFVETTQVGFIKSDEFKRTGCSPDSLIGEDGGLEIKCPFNSINHINYLEGEAIPKAYYAQIQGNLMITKRKWWDFVSFDPRIKDERFRMHVRRVERDEEFIAKLKIEIVKFLEIYEQELIKYNLQ